MTIQHSAITSLIILTNKILFQNKHKLFFTAFTRNRKLTFSTMVGMILRMIKKSIQIDCNWLADLIGSDPVSKQAFSQARQKISPECFQELHADGIRVNYTSAPEKGLWKGYRLIACDGSTARLPESTDLEKTFGRHPTKKGIKNAPPIARISEYTDMTTKLVLSGRIAPCCISEVALAEEQLTEVVDKMRNLNQKKMLFVYDRGYPSKKFIDQHLELGVDFIFRLPRNFNREVKEIYQKKEAESFLISKDYPLLRVMQFTLSSGESELLLTTLLNDQQYSQESLSKVYHGRWSAMEEGYKRQKIIMQLENFSGKTAIAIQQEYWATLTVGNLIEMGCIEIEGYWIPEKLPKSQVNRSVVFGSMRDATIAAIFGIMPMKEYSKKFRKIAKKSMLKIRPWRCYSRNGVGKPKRNHVYRRSC